METQVGEQFSLSYSNNINNGLPRKATRNIPDEKLVPANRPFRLSGRLLQLHHVNPAKMHFLNDATQRNSLFRNLFFTV